MPTVFDVANYFLARAGEEDEQISNLKLQKLLYYAQGFHLAIYDEPLFAASIEAWTHGPVVPDAYRRFKDYGSGSIPAPEAFDPAARMTTDQINFLEEVFDVFGQFSAWKLRNMTHQESPWLNHEAAGDAIPAAEMKEHFLPRVD